jgi:arginine repressor
VEDLAQKLLSVAQDKAYNLDTLAPAIVESVLVHKRSQRWVSKYLKEQNYNISHASISRHLQKVNENWTSVLDTVTSSACIENQRVEVRWLASTCLAFRTHKGTFWVRTPPIPSVKDLQNEAKNLLDKIQIAGLIVLELTSKGFTIVPKMNLQPGPRATA